MSNIIDFMSKKQENMVEKMNVDSFLKQVLPLLTAQELFDIGTATTKEAAKNKLLQAMTRLKLSWALSTLGE